MKKQLLLFLLALLPMVASADAVEIDGIYYNLDDGTETAEVTKKPSGQYTGTVVIPASVTYGSVNYSVTSIGSYAFSGCSGLTSITIPNSVTSIGKSAFSGCSGLTSVTIPNSVTSIGNYAFQDCTGLTSVSIPNSVTSIGSEAFSYCSGLTSVTIGNSVTSIGNYAFYECSGLTSIAVEGGNTTYDSRNDCNAIIETSTNTLIVGCKTTVIPNIVTSIGDRAFDSCHGLTSITIPNSVTSIGEMAFWGCDGLTSVTIPNSVTSIGDYAFCDCSGLTSISIPNSVTSIGNYAFYECSGLTSVTIGNSVTSIGDWAFCVCTGLTDLYCYAEKVPTAGLYVFRNDPVSSATLHVPAASIDAYKAADQWKEFGTIIAITPEETGVESITAAENPSDRKFMENGRLIIQKNGQRYNAAGQMVKEK